MSSKRPRLSPGTICRNEAPVCARSCEFCDGECRRRASRLRKVAGTNIIVRPLKGYNLPEWVRVSVGTTEQNKKCIGALKEILSGHRRDLLPGRRDGSPARRSPPFLLLPGKVLSRWFASPALNAIAVADTIFRGKEKPSRFVSHVQHFGEILDGADRLIDQVMLSTHRAPASYTGEDLVEISCHGGALVSAKVLEARRRAGARRPARANLPSAHF